MKRLLIVFSVIVASLFILTACGETESETLGGDVKDEEAVNKANNDEESSEDEVEAEVEENEINEVIADGMSKLLSLKSQKKVIPFLVIAMK